MSEDTESCEKRVNESIDVASGVDYPKSPISRSPRMPKATTHFPSSPSGPGSSRFRHKSPASRHLSPHRSMSKNKIMFDWEDANNSLRKTQSTALTAVINSPWSRSWTVSTPDLKIGDQSVETNDGRGGENADPQVPRRPKLNCSLQLILVILSCTILAAGLTHLGVAFILTVYKENVLIIVEYRSYVSSVIALYINSIILIVWPLIGLWLIRRRSWKKQHLVCSLHMAVFTIALGMFQSTVQTNIRNKTRERMMASISTQLELPETTGSVWDYIQKSFKCCGTQGHLDWCVKTDGHDDSTKSMNFLGTYICHLPVSCCNEDIDEIVSSGKFSKYAQRTAPCSVSPTPWNTNRAGCFGHVKREMQYAAKLLRIICFGPAIFFVVSSAVAAILSYFV